MRFEQHQTPDTGWAWVISVSCATINGLTFGLIRSSGVFFFYFRKEYQVSRQTASWPFTLGTSCAYLSGPIAAFLITYFHLRTIVFLGILFASFGFAACFLTHDINQLTILIGLVHGFGIGLSYMQTPVIIVLYFKKYVATANAISYAGGTVGSFLFPPLIELFIKWYGLKGCFLMIGGILLNGLPCALLLRPPESGPLYTLNSAINQSTKMIKNTRPTKVRHERLRKSSVDLYAEKKNNTLLNEMASSSGHLTESAWSNCQINKKQSQTMMQHFEQAQIGLIECNQSNKMGSDRKNSSQSKTKANKRNRHCQTMPLNEKNLITAMIQVITNPLYIILLITYVTFQWGWMTYQVVIFDFGIDQNLSSAQSMMALIVFAWFDLIGRIVSGLLADKELIKKNHTVSICILVIGFLILITSLINSYTYLMILTILLGFFCGVIIVLFNLLTMEYVGLDNLPVALAFSSFCVGISNLCRPYVIGLFRDVFGSYDGLFQFSSTLSFVAAFLCLFEPFALLSHKRKKTIEIVAK